MDNNKRKHEWNVIVKLGQRDRPTTGWRRWLRKASCCDWMDPYFLPFRPQNHEDKQEHFGAHESRKWVSHVDDRLHTLYGLVGTDFAFVCQVGGRTLLILLLWMCNEVSDCVIPAVNLPSLSSYDRRGERRMHFDGAEFVVRNSGHSAGFDSNNLLRVYW